MAYEIRVVFQSAEAYQSAVEGLYRAFGVDVPPRERSGTDGNEAEGGARAAEEPAIEDAFGLDPVDLAGDGYSFTVEDQTR
jgi:hypothetical protein